MPASALGGFGQSLIFTCVGTCIQRLSEIYSKVTERDAGAIQALFFGIFGTSIEIGIFIKNN